MLIMSYERKEKREKERERGEVRDLLGLVDIRPEREKESLVVFSLPSVS